MKNGFLVCLICIAGVIPLGRAYGQNLNRRRENLAHMAELDNIVDVALPSYTFISGSWRRCE